jgi:uncharacterized membrane protein (UPF0127 family)
MNVALINERTNKPVATLVEIAATRRTRRRGLLGRDGLDEASAMLLAPCAAVHTIGMRFAIDVVFVDRQGYAVKIVRNLRPWRMAVATGGRAVIEMAAGSLAWGEVLPGDRLYLAPVSAPADASNEAVAPAPVPAAVEKRAVPAMAGLPVAATAGPGRSFAARLRGTAGTNILEAAIITPLLLLLTLSIVDFGVLFYIYLALENGVSQATRYGVTGNALDDPLHPGTPLSHDESIKLAMRQATPTLTIPDAAFSFSNMPVGGATWAGGSGGPNALSKLSVRYTWRFINPMLWPFFPGGQITLNVESSMKNEGAPGT